MGLGASRLLTRHEEEFEDGERVLNARAFDKFGFYIDWNLEDIHYARSRLEKKALDLNNPSSGDGEASSSSTAVPLGKAMTRWEDFYVISYEVKERHQQTLEEAGMRTWHPACGGYVMRKDDDAEELLSAYQLEELFRPKKGNERHDYHTDDEKSEVDEGEEREKEEEEEGGENEVGGRQSLAASDITTGPSLLSINAAGEGMNPNDASGGVEEQVAAVGEEEGGAERGGGNDGEAAQEEPDQSTGVDDKTSLPPNADAPIQPPPRQPSPEVEVFRRPLPEAFDPAKRSPIFFGYHSITIEEQIQERAAAVNQAESGESEALARLRKKRSDKVDILVQEANAKRSLREKRIQEVQDSQSKKQEDRERDSKKVEKMLGPDEYKAWLLTFQKDGEGILAANQAELEKMKTASQAKYLEDEVAIKELQTQLKAYDDLMSLSRPQGPLLVETARRELLATSDALRDRMQAMKNVQQDLSTLNDEMENADISLAAQTRSLRLSIEARLNEERRKVEAVLQEMNDTEVLLHGAMARKVKEEKILPLFACLKHSTETDDYLPLQELLVGLTLTSKDEPFSEKLRYLLSLFDYNHNHFLGGEELIQLLHMVFRFLGHSAFMRVQVSREEVESLVVRAFLLEKIDPGQGMTLYEAKEWLRTLVSRSRAIAALLNCTWADSELSTYQRQSMDGIHQLEKGILTITDLKYHMAKHLITYRPLLAPDSKMTMHSRALARGADDPLKANYSRFIYKKSKGSLSKVVPLLHGHLGSLLEWQRRVKTRAATMLQAVYRGIKGRQRAEIRAKVLAFERAKETALQRMRDKVKQEVLAKEALTGIEKMKYDAKIRNRAAKMRAAGQQAERDDVLAAIIKEGVDAGEREVRLRFREIAKEKGLDQHMDDFAAEGAQELKAVAAAVKNNQVDLSLAIAAATSEKTASILSPRAAEKEGVAALEVLDKKGVGEETFINLADAKEGLSQDILDRRRQALVWGRHPLELFHTGETIAEQLLRFQLILPDLSREDLYQRLRSLEGVLTQMKVEEMMLELPSKRLLMAYVDRMGKYDLPYDLQDHFRIVRAFEVVSEILRDVMKSDLDYGVISTAARSFYQSQHGIVETHWQSQLQRGLKRATEMMGKAGRSAALIALSPEEQVQAMREKELINIRKKQEALSQNEGNLAKVTKKIKNTRSALEELGRRLRDLDRYLIVKVRKDPIVEDMPVDQRVDWYGRYSAALRWSEDSKQALQAKYTEISNVVHDFVHMAERLAAIIINELYLPIDQKTIKPVEERVCDGRAKEGGRGIGGMGIRYKYEAWNIRLKVLVDDHGIFNGSDECAAKAGGAERRNTMEVHKLYVQGLGVPLVTTVDYHGFRVLAVSKMPTESVKYSEAGDIRGRKEQFCFGTQDRGDTFVDSERKLSSLLEAVSKKLNLSKHAIKAFKDINSKNIWGSADLRGYKGEDGIYHVLNFWRLFPCEYPNLAHHLTSSPRDMSMFFRFLRPEFVRKWPEPLSPDANLVMINGTNDIDKQMTSVREATTTLIQETIMNFAEYLCKLGKLTQIPAWQGFGLDLTHSLHRYGINVRHLGHLRSLFWRRLGGTVNVVYNTRRLVTHSDVRLEVERGAHIRIRGEMYQISMDPKDEFSEHAITLTEKVRQLSENYVEIWSGEVSDDVNSEQIRLLILAEMVARATKNLLRSYLRMILKIMHTSTEYMQIALITDFLNVLTGSHLLSSVYWSEQLYHSIIVRYGPMSVSYNERPNLRLTLAPIIIYIVERLQDMIGFRIARDCLGAFSKCPASFRFTTQDIIPPISRVKHNIPILAFADAMLLNLQADNITSRTYSDHVLDDKPLLYWKFSERRGSKLAYNYGSLGTDVSGSYSPAIIFEAAGPIKNEEINRAVRLHAAEKAKIDSVYNAKLAPSSAADRFSVEIWARVLGGWDTHRVLFMNSRYSLAVTRENRWALQILAKYVQVTLVGAEVDREAWTHLVFTYDGTLVRLYINGTYVVGMELSAELEKQLEALRASRQEDYDKLALEERKEKELCWQQTEHECAKYFRSKDGRNLLKKQTMKLIEQAEFQARLGGAAGGGGGGAGGGHRESIVGESETAATSPGGSSSSGNQSGLMRSLSTKKPALLTPEEATEQAMAAYRKETYGKNVRSINEKFKILREELCSTHAKQDYEAQVKLTTTLRVGSTGPNRSTNTGSAFFDGELCHFAIYDKDLNHDRIQAHYLSGTRERSVDSERLYFLASEKFNEAMRFAPDDPVALAKYAESVCNYVHIDGAQALNERRTKNKIAQAMKVFIGLENYDAIAELLRRLPNEYGFSDIACHLYEAIITARPDYFKGTYFSYKDLALVPNRFMLYESQDTYQIEMAARMYKTIMEDSSLALFYGDDDLTFIRKIKSAKVILALVKQVQLGQDKRVLDLNAYRDCTEIDDEDMHIVADYRRGALGIALKNCLALTDQSIKDIARYCPNLHALTLDGCVQVTNESLLAVGKYCKELQLLSLERCLRITDSALASVVDACKQIKILNINQCTQLSDEVLLHIAHSCKELELLHMSHCFMMTDPGIFNFTTEVNPTALISLDVSACKGLSDDGYEAIGRGLTSLTYINISSARITDIGMRGITHNLWKLKSLIMRDLYLVSDEVFQFDTKGDGRREAEEKMLTSLTELDMTDCSRLGDRALACISSRCIDLSILRISGCSNVTDMGVAHLFKDPKTGQERGQHLTQVHVAYCIQLTNQAIEALCQACEKLDVLDVSGCVHLTDEMVHAIARNCPHLQTLGLSRCKRLTDQALCTLVDYLWIEDLDLSYCNKITDEGIEVVALEFQGLKRLNVSWLHRLTDRSLRALLRHCRNSLEWLNVTECSGMSLQGMKDLQMEMPRMKILSHHPEWKEGGGGGAEGGGGKPMAAAAPKE